MEIPYTVEHRPDTGIYNAKLGIWLFLASEVMLFGGLFSAYILLRVGAAPGDWPHGWLDVKLGTINTVVLASSAITTLLAWVACKVRQFGKFKFFHACTIMLGLTFLCLHGMEYYDEWTHYEVKLTSGKVADGHLVEQSKDFNLADKTGSLKLEGRVVDDSHELIDLHTPEAQAALAKEEEMTIPASEISSMANYSPRYNTFTAIYYTMTGLHGLHVLGGTLVIFYLWGPGRRLYFTDPERYTNRIEVSGLFWHFVDLVWIFLFPVLYLT